MFSKSYGLIATGFLVALLAGGCGGPDDVPPLGQVSGTVTMNGKPLTGATVVFQPAEGGRPSQGTTDESGHYTLIYSTSQTGAKAGKHKVRITYNRLMGSTSGPAPTVPPKYNSKSQLTEVVKPGEENVINFELQSS